VRSIHEIPLSSSEVPVINLLVSILPARNSVIYYLNHPIMLLQLMMQHNLQRYISCSLFAGAPHLRLKYSGERCLSLCACVLACRYTHTHTHTLLCQISAASCRGPNVEHRNMSRNSAVAAMSVAAQFVDVIQTVVASLLLTTRIGFNSLFRASFLL
jgi:hypothetical protein